MTYDGGAVQHVAGSAAKMARAARFGDGVVTADALDALASLARRWQLKPVSPMLLEDLIRAWRPPQRNKTST